jgi:hypothetical protein
MTVENAVRTIRFDPMVQAGFSGLGGPDLIGEGIFLAVNVYHADRDS